MMLVLNDWVNQGDILFVGFYLWLLVGNVCFVVVHMFWICVRLGLWFIWVSVLGLVYFKLSVSWV